MKPLRKKTRISKWHTNLARKTRRYIAMPFVQKVLVYVSSATLLLSTAYWTILGASIQRGNADQLVNTYLFENSTTFHGAEMPGQHTFLLKWPIFWLIKFFGYSDIAYISLTVIITLVTVAALAYILYRIVRKPIIFSLICLSLASVLIAIPAQPYKGAFLPINMAMLTTRNIEYIIYIASLILLVRIRKVTIWSWRFWLAAILLGLLIASDKLFLPLTLGGSLLALAVYGILKKRHLITFPINWLIASVTGGGLAFGMLWVTQTFTHIVSPNGTSPYDFVRTAHDFILGCAYAVLDLFTNFGANPAYDAIELKQLPQQVILHLFSAGGLVFIVNIFIAGFGLFTCQRLIHTALLTKRYRKLSIDQPTQFALALLSTTIVAIAVFITTNHYYPVDARYLTISLFALTVTIATVLRDAKIQKWIQIHIIPISLILCVGIVAGSISATHSYKDEAVAMDTTSSRNTSIAAAMTQHRSRLLIGDYWRVIPARQSSGNTFTALPLANCFDPRDILTSSAWQTDLSKHAFAYLVSFDVRSPDFPSCSLDQIVSHYGKPNASTVIAGTLENPKEVVLFYDYGIQHTTALKHTAPATVVPTVLEQLPTPTCTTGGKTIVSTVAHQDDDLLFMNPDHMHALTTGDCLRTIYMTAGDAGSGELYWLGRERGSEEAYDVMAAVSETVWIQKIIKLSDHQFITVVNPRNNPNMSLIFMHLPDGNVTGSGFATTHYESLARLESTMIPSIDTVDGQSTYTKAELTNALIRIMDFYKPGEIDTQAPVNLSKVYPDHSDHMAVGRYTQIAFNTFRLQHPESTTAIKYYVGYPIHASAPNVDNQDYQNKADIFFTYSHFDDGGCTTFLLCNTQSVYGQYLRRQYSYSF